MSQLSKLFINNQWVDGPHRITAINPSNEQVIQQVHAAGPAEVDSAVRAARAAFERGSDWSLLSGTERATFLRRIAEGVRSKKPALARLEAENCGKPLPESEWDIDDVAGCFDYYAELAEKLDARQNSPIELPDARFKTVIRFEPIGVVGLIIPWNYPLLMAAWKVAPALAAGNSVVLKPSEFTPITALHLAEIVKEAGLPAGVFNVVNGTGPVAGEALVSHRQVDKISFTGSTATGSRIMSTAAKDIRKVSLELGGKSPIIVFDDVDIEKAVEWIMFGVFWTNGQICSSTSRLLVHEKIADRLLARLKEETEKIQIGDALADGTKLGPVVSQSQYDKVMSFIESGKKSGATLLTGGGRAPGFSKGFFIQPTVFVNVPADASIWRDEIFGPVLSVRTFKEEQEAIAEANNTEYGLAGAVLSSDKDRCNRIARLFRCGIVWVNCSQPCFCQNPWGGFKRSGIGRDLGTYGLDKYTEVKQITTMVSDESWGWYIKPRL